MRSCRGGNGMSGRGSNLNAGSSSPGHRAQAASRRAAGQGSHSPASSREPPWGEQRPGVKGDGQGTRAVPGIGFARLRPARRRPCRQGVNSAAGPGEGHHRLQADSSRSDIPCGATSRSRNTSPNGLRASRPALRPPFPHFPAAMPGSEESWVAGDWWLVAGDYRGAATLTAEGRRGRRLSPDDGQPPATNHQPPTTSHQPPATSHQPPATNHQPPSPPPSGEPQRPGPASHRSLRSCKNPLDFRRVITECFSLAPRRIPCR